ncbi:MAG: molybdopterin-dependent oxidoreductase [Candidatus Dormibacteraceae bacterium]
MISIRRGAVAGLVAGLAFTFGQALLRLIGVSLPSELVADRVLPHVPVDQFLHLLGLMGGALAAKQQALVGGFFGSVVAGVVLGGVYALLLGRPALARRPHRTLLGALAVAWFGTMAALWPVLPASYLGLGPRLAAAATAVGFLLEFAIYVAVLDLTLRWTGPRATAAADTDESRRRLMLGMIAGIFAIGTAGTATFLYKNSALGYDGMTYDGPVLPLTPNQSFYTVTKNLIDPAVYQPAWRLDVTGRVAHPKTYQLADLTSLPNCTTQETTLECISNGVGRGLISNAAWHGVPLRTLLEAAGPMPGAAAITFRAVDGYVHTASLDTAMADGTFLAWLMNGQPLPDRHGFPLRLLVPSAYGEVSVKWITQIEVVDQAESGYYETQGWQPRFVQTMSRIDSPKKGQVVKVGSGVQLEGIAYAADRGISQVEVSTDGGSTWSAAQITYGKPMTWSLWQVEWTPTQAGTAVLKVRARDGKGEPQAERSRGFAPAGSTGLHMVQVTVAP